MTRALANLILWCNKNEFIMNEQDKFVDEYNTAKASTILNFMCKKLSLYSPCSDSAINF